jgi:hypothetical protein
MSEDDFKRFQSWLEGIQTEHKDVIQRLTNIETLLKERCDVRGKEMADLKTKVDVLRIAHAKIIGISTALAMVGTYIMKGLGWLK